MGNVVREKTCYQAHTHTLWTRLSEHLYSEEFWLAASCLGVGSGSEHFRGVHMPAFYLLFSCYLP